MGVWRFFFLVCIFASIDLTGIAIPYHNTLLRFRRHHVDDGLSENTVFSIVQDRRGFMWFGTKDGLNRFDGREFRVFRIGDGERAPGNSYIRSITLHGDGTLWVGTDVGVYVMDPERETFTRFEGRTQHGTAVSRVVHGIMSDNRNRIWIASNEGIFMWNPAEGKLDHYYPGNGAHTIPSSTAWCVFQDRNDHIWVGTREGLVKYDEQKEVFLDYSDSSAMVVGDDEIMSILEDSNGNMWLGTWSGGLKRLDRATKRFDPVIAQSKNNVSHIRSLLDYDDESIIVGSDDGLFLVNKFDHSIRRLIHPDVHDSLSDKSVYCIYRDREEGLWFGTYFGGVNYLLSDDLGLFNPNPTGNSLSGKAVSRFCADEQENLWIATEDGGLNYFNTRTNTFENHRVPSGISYHNIHALMIDGDDLWIGIFSRGIDVYNRRTGTIKNLRHDHSRPGTVSDDCVFSLYRDSRGDIYAGTPMSLDRYDRRNGTFTSSLSVGGSYIRDIAEDAQGDLWVATNGSGAFRRDSTGQWHNYRRHDDLFPSCIGHNQVTGFFTDRENRLWLSTGGGGISLYDREHDTFTSYTDADGLSNNMTYRIQQDKAGNIWVSTNKGLTRFHPENPSSVLHLTRKDGLQSNEFNYGASFAHSDGRLFFGGINGFNAFYPEKLSFNPVQPGMAITSIKLANDDDDALSYRRARDERMVIPYNKRSITISYISLSYVSPHKNRYRYILDGADKDWHRRTDQNKVTYLNLAPGNYTFRVAGTNNDGVWSDEVSANFIIKPPFWLSLCAKLFYLLIFATGLYLLLRHNSARIRKRSQRKLQEYRHAEEKRNFNSKINFFTSIAHEIRTPVSLIKAPLETILAADEWNEEVRDNLRIIDRNASRLTELINQLLDFRKLDAADYRLKIHTTDIYELLDDIVSQFKALARGKNVEFRFEAPPGIQRQIISDKDALTKIVVNLLGNAMKFTRDTIDVRLHTEGDDFVITVADNGCGIPDGMKTQIFDLFFQVNALHPTGNGSEGTGIGLSLAKLLAEKLNGSISVSDNNPQGSIFTFRFKPQLGDDTQIGDAIPVRTDQHTTQKHTVLVVDDNDDLRHFVTSNLRQSYHLLSAGSASEAIGLMETQLIDVVVLDIMMPGVDGLELTHRVRNNPQLCHLPIILLSAKTHIDTKVQGLESGADVFIEKPFSLIHLRAQIDSVIAGRERIYTLFATSNVSQYSSLVRNANDRDLIERINKEIEKELSNPDLNVESLSEEIGQSRSNLQRKLKAISGMTPNDYLRTYRLKRASQLLKDDTYRINEVSYLVGFSSPSYFSKCFSRQFGMLPKEYRDNWSNSDKNGKTG